MRVNSFRIFPMASARSHGQMAAFTKENSQKEKKKEQEFTKTAPTPIQVLSITIKSTIKGEFFTKMVMNMMACGRKV